VVCMLLHRLCIVQMSCTSHATILTTWIVAKLSFMTRYKRSFLRFCEPFSEYSYSKFGKNGFQNPFGKVTNNFLQKCHGKKHLFLCAKVMSSSKFCVEFFCEGYVKYTHSILLSIILFWVIRNCKLAGNSSKCEKKPS
jgi:hypothetical protein